jgi:hypothetical protein
MANKTKLKHSGLRQRNLSAFCLSSVAGEQNEFPEIEAATSHPKE